MSQTATEVISPGASAPVTGWREIIQAISNLIIPTNKELITILRTPTPVKTAQVFQANAVGCIGGGLDTPDPVSLFQCPMSCEAWLHRITITCPDHGPAEPLTAGEAYCIGSTSGEILFFLPYHGDIAPIQIIEGRLSAPHLNGGEVAGFVADQLPPGTHLRIDMQIILTTGVSDFTPRRTAPTNLDRGMGTGLPGLE